MFHILNDKGEEYIIDNECRVTASKMPDDSWKRMYAVEYSEAPEIEGTYSEILDLFNKSVIENNGSVTLMYLDAKKHGFINNITEVNEFLPYQFKKIRYSAVDIYQGNSDAIENLLQDESLIDVLDNLVPLEILHLIKYLESDEERKDLAETANNYIEWLAYGDHLFCSEPDAEVERLNKLKENIKISS